MPSDTASQTRSGPRGWPADRWPLATVHREAAVVGALRAGDEAAFVELVRRHHATMLHVARGFVATDTVAEEVVQETWVAVLDQLDRFEGRSTLKTWIFRILVNRAKSRGVREHRLVPFSSLQRGDDGPAVDPSQFRDGAWATAPRPWQDPERRLMSLDARAALRAALAALPPRQRMVIALRDVEGLPADEVAELLSLSECNQRVLLHRARARLRSVLDELVDA